jgi:hypothetical protein
LKCRAQNLTSRSELTVALRFSPGQSIRSNRCITVTTGLALVARVHEAHEVLER